MQFSHNDPKEPVRSVPVLVGVAQQAGGEGVVVGVVGGGHLLVVPEDVRPRVEEAVERSLLVLDVAGHDLALDAVADAGGELPHAPQLLVGHRHVLELAKRPREAAKALGRTVHHRQPRSHHIFPVVLLALALRVLEGNAGEELAGERPVVARETLAHQGRLEAPRAVVRRTGHEAEPHAVAVAHVFLDAEKVDDMGKARAVPEDAALPEGQSASLGHLKGKLPHLLVREQQVVGRDIAYDPEAALLRGVFDLDGVACEVARVGRVGWDFDDGHERADALLRAVDRDAVCLGRRNQADVAVGDLPRARAHDKGGGKRWGFRADVQVGVHGR